MSFDDFGNYNSDYIYNINAGDKIDLSAIDANSNLAGNQAFTFINNNYFSYHAGELAFQGGEIIGDINGDAMPDFSISVDATGTSTFSFSSSAFIL